MTTAPPPVLDAAAQAVMDLEREYLLQNYARYPLVLAKGKGCHLYDLAGKRYLDFLSGIGVNALGLHHLGDRGDGRRPQDGALAWPRHTPRKIPGDCAGERVPWAHLRRAFHHRTTQVPPGF